MALLNRTADPEIILPIILKEQISSDYEEETLKAQAVIARSNLFRKLKNKNEMEKEYKKLQEKNLEKWKICVFMDKKEQKFEDAVKSTKGQILTFNGEVKLVPYHEISAGQTRNGEIAFHDSEYAYLKGVDSSADKAASDYFNSVYINRQQLPEELKVKDREEKHSSHVCNQNDYQSIKKDSKKIISGYFKYAVKTFGLFDKETSQQA